MEGLPGDVALDIFSRLPFESVLDCKLVSKKLLDTIRKGEKFLWSKKELAPGKRNLVFSYVKPGEITERRSVVRLYYDESYNDEMNILEEGGLSDVELNQTKFYASTNRIEDACLGSCNGLICLKSSVHGLKDAIRIFNPITEESVVIDVPKISEEEDLTSVFGFGCSATKREYKVVRYYLKNDSEGVVEVYTIGSGLGWRTIPKASLVGWGQKWETVPTFSYIFHRARQAGVFVDGAIHWFGVWKREHSFSSHVFAFNLDDELFRRVNTQSTSGCPNNLWTHTYALHKQPTYQLVALAGKLCIYKPSDDTSLNIWSFDVQEDRWSVDFSIPYGSPQHGSTNLSRLVPIFVTKKKVLLLVHNQSTLYCFDPTNTRVIRLWPDESMNRVRFLGGFPHMDSYVSPKALGEAAGCKPKPG